MGKERRITEQLISYWNEIKSDRNFPALSDIRSSDILDLWCDCFMVEMKYVDGRRRHRYIYLGESIRDMFGGDLTGASVMALADDLADKYRKVVETKKPLVDESEFINLQDDVVKYRQILLPVGPDNETVDHVFGGMRYRIFSQAVLVGTSN